MADIVRVIADDGSGATATLIDFLTGDYKLLKDGIEMPVPEAKRIEGGDSPVTEGTRIIERQYNNREITLVFDINAADYDTLVNSVRAIQSTLDRALLAHKGLAKHEKIYLKYQRLEAVDTDPVVFDIIDGELQIGNLADPRVKRDSRLSKCELTLICEPFGRLENPRVLRNLLVNGGFDWNPQMQGMPGSQYILTDASGERLELADASGLEGTGAPSPLAAGLYVYPTASGLSEIAHCGSTTTAWKLQLAITTRKALFTWYESDGTSHLLTSDNGLALNEWHSVAFCLYSTDGTDIVAVLMVDDRVEATERIASPLAMRTPVGKFTMGATAGDGSRFVGRLHSIYIITGQQILPYQLSYLNRFGFGMLQEEYFGLDSSELALFCKFSETSGDMLDVSGNSQDLALQGTTSRSDLAILPEAWTIGSELLSLGKTGLQRGANTVTVPGHGPFGLFWNVAPGEGDANYYIEQTITLPEGETQATLVFWIRASNASFGKLELLWEGDSETITLSDTSWHQYYWTQSGISAGGSTTIRFRWTQATPQILVFLDSVALYAGLPFEAKTTPTERTAIIPYVGSSKMQNTPDFAFTNAGAAVNDARVSWLDIIDMDGDAPAICRVLLKNTDSVSGGPIRIGYGRGKNSWENVLYWHMSLFAPIFANTADYDSVYPDPKIETAAAVTLTDRIAISLARLFPYPNHQHGSYKAYVVAEGEEDMTSLLRLETSQAKIALTQDPLKDNATDTSKIPHDMGILTWPPELGMSQVVDRFTTGRSRKKVDDAMTPKLLISNIVDAVVASPNIAYHELYLLPVEQFAVLRQASISTEDGLQQDEIMVVDSLDENMFGVSYLLKEVTIASSANLSKLAMMASPDLAIYTTGFKIDVNTPVFFAGQVCHNDVHFPWGRIDSLGEFEMWIEYSPRFLYI